MAKIKKRNKKGKNILFFPKQVHRFLHRDLACIEMPVKVLMDAYELSQKKVSSLDKMLPSESHLAIKALCEWWNENAPVKETRCAGYIMVWERVGDTYECSYCETPIKKIQNYMGNESSLARVGDDIIIEFWKGKKDFTYNKEGCLETYRVNGKIGWIVGVSESEVSSDNYDEAWYGLDGLRRLKKIKNSHGDMAYFDSNPSGLSLCLL